MKKAIKKRKVVRFITYFTILISIAAAIPLAAWLLFDRGEVGYASGDNLEFKMNNCIFYILDHNGKLSNDVFVEYKVSRYNSNPVTIADKTLTF